MEITLRRVRPDEHGRVADLVVAAYAPGLAPDDPYLPHLRDVAGRDQQAEVWVAVDDDTLLGTVTWCPTGSPLREVAADDELEFRMLAVAPAAQGRGIGGALLHWVIDRACAEAYAAVALCSAEWMTTAHGMYERAGFFRVPARDWTPREGVHLRAYARSAQQPCGC